MNNRSLKQILEQMQGKKTGSTYGGPIPDGVKKIIRISKGMFDYTEVEFENLDEELLRQIIYDAGLNYKKKKRMSDFPCGCVANLFERMWESDRNTLNTYTITKPGIFCFYTAIAVVVDNSIRVYDTQKAIEIAAEILDQYLKEKGRSRAQTEDNTTKLYEDSKTEN